jgi:3-keto-disaccharide hydrolase
MKMPFALLPIALSLTTLAATAADDGWISLFDGKTLNGWKASEATNSWTVKDGAIVANARDRSHLFYVGDGRPFKDFEFKADVMTKPGSNSGIYIHTKYQETGWPKYGFEVQVNNTHSDPIKTASLYQVANVMNNSPAKDNEWFTMDILVQGKHAIVKVNGKVVNEYTEPDGQQPGKDFTRVFDEGTFALQAHDPKSFVYFKNIMVKRLP